MTKKNTESAVMVFETELNEAERVGLATTFNEFEVGITDLLKQAASIEVASIEDKEAMKLARSTRLALRQVRIDVEKTRKELKAESLLKGKAIDGMANIIKYKIEPVERDLQEKEDFVKRIEAERVAALVSERTSELAQLDVDCSCFDLGAMTDEAFGALLASSKVVHAAKVAEAKAEADRQAKEARERAEEQERIRKENERLKAEAEAREAELQAERDAKEKAERAAAKAKAEAEAKAKKAKSEADRKAKAIQDAADKAAREEQARREAELQAEKDAEIAQLQAEKDAEQARKMAPDKDKLTALDAAICGLDVPQVSSDVAIEAVTDVRAILNNAVKVIRQAVSEMSNKK
jgi:hypothetical protein